MKKQKSKIPASFMARLRAVYEQAIQNHSPPVENSSQSRILNRFDNNQGSDARRQPPRGGKDI